MPIYCYRKEDSEVIEIIMSCDQKSKKEFTHDGKTAIFLDNGEIAYRDLETELKGTRTFPGNWPLFSDAFGCAEGQEAEAHAASIRAGVPVEYINGKAKFESPSHRKRALRSFGMFDKSAFC